MPNDHHKLEEIMRYLYAERAGIESRFDSKYKERLDELYEELLRLFNALQEAMYNNENFSDGAINASLILWKSLKSLLASLQLLRAGYWGDATSLLRDPLESAAVALYLHNHPEGNKEFHEKGGKGLYGKALDEAYKIFPAFKTQRKLLSEIFVHPSEFDGVIEWKGDRFSMVGVFDENQLHRYDQTLLEIELVLTNLGKMIEYVFFDFFPSPIFWGKTKEGHLEPKEHAIKFLNRFIDSAELIKENTGVDILEDRPDNDKKTKDYKSLLRKYAEKRKTSKGK